MADPLNQLMPLETAMRPADVIGLRRDYPSLIEALRLQQTVINQLIIRAGGSGSGGSTTDLTSLTAQVEALEDDVYSVSQADLRAQVALDAAERAESMGDQVALIPSIMGMINELRSASTGAAYGDAVEHDFGADPVYDASFTITDANISASSIILVTPGGAATGRTADDWQWDGATVGVNPGAGSATCYVTFHPGPVVGPRSFNYTVI